MEFFFLIVCISVCLFFSIGFAVYIEEIADAVLASTICSVLFLILFNFLLEGGHFTQFTLLILTFGLVEIGVLNTLIIFIFRAIRNSFWKKRN